NPYGQDLEQGNITVELRDGELCVTYFENVLPVDPQTIPLLFEPFSRFIHKDDGENVPLADLVRLLGEMKLLPGNNVTNAGLISRRQREAPALLQRFRRLVLENPSIQAILQQSLAAINGQPGDMRSYDLLHRLLEAQVYRLAFWRVSAEEINY